MPVVSVAKIVLLIALDITLEENMLFSAFSRVISAG
jgi:hypothetical protein